MSEPISGFETPRPPAELRAKTLAAAAARWSRPDAPDRWRRIWESTPLRLTWAATVVVLVALDLFLFLPRKASAARVATSASDELQQLTKLPRLRDAYVTAAPEPKKEKRS